jgi:PilZ domain
MPKFDLGWQSVCTSVEGTSAKVLGLELWKIVVSTRFLIAERERMRLTPAERRRAQRIHVQIPMFVRGTDAAGLEFLDLTKTLDISATGAYLASPRAIRTNQVVNLTIPAPSSPSATLPAETPPIQARVRRHRAAEGFHLLGVEFLKTLD